jgi:hypothetical protein
LLRGVSIPLWGFPWGFSTNSGTNSWNQNEWKPKHGKITSGFWLLGEVSWPCILIGGAYNLFLFPATGQGTNRISRSGSKRVRSRQSKGTPE